MNVRMDVETAVKMCLPQGWGWYAVKEGTRRTDEGSIEQNIRVMGSVENDDVGGNLVVVAGLRVE